MKSELDFQYRVSNIEEKDLWQGALVKYRDNVFGHVLRKHSDNNYSVTIKKECKWFRGQRKLCQVHRQHLQMADDAAFRFECLRYEIITTKDGIRIRKPSTDTRTM